MKTAPDGSPVELYARLRPAGEPELITSVLPPEASVLELGCGTGRIADALVALGHPTTGVDQSAAMLAHVHRATPVLAGIEGLDLRRRFDGVVLASHLVNAADRARRREFLTTCVRHLDPGGVVLVERHDPAWAAQVDDGPLGERDGVRFALERVTRNDDRLNATSVYVIDGRTLRHRWTAQILNDAALDRELAAVGLPAFASSTRRRHGRCTWPRNSPCSLFGMAATSCRTPCGRVPTRQVSTAPAAAVLGRQASGRAWSVGVDLRSLPLWTPRTSFAAATMRCPISTEAIPRHQRITPPGWRSSRSGLLPGGAVLDLGCGCGVPLARDLAASGYEVIGIDLSAVQVERARHLIPTASFLHADATQVRFPPSAFDAVVSLYALIHMPLDEQPALLGRIGRWLRPGGWFLATTGHRAWTGTEDGWLGGDAPMWWSHADAATYRAWIDQAGLAVVAQEVIPEGDGVHALFWARRPLDRPQ